jgi:hypothetical protein
MDYDGWAFGLNCETDQTGQIQDKKPQRTIRRHPHVPGGEPGQTVQPPDWPKDLAMESAAASRRRLDHETEHLKRSALPTRGGLFPSAEGHRRNGRRANLDRLPCGRPGGLTHRPKPSQDKSLSIRIPVPWGQRTCFGHFSWLPKRVVPIRFQGSAMKRPQGWRLGFTPWARNMWGRPHTAWLVLPVCPHPAGTAQRRDSGFIA